MIDYFYCRTDGVARGESNLFELSRVMTEEDEVNGSNFNRRLKVRLSERNAKEKLVFLFFRKPIGFHS